MKWQSCSNGRLNTKRKSDSYKKTLSMETTYQIIKKIVTNED